MANELADVAVRVAIRGAKEYLTSHGLTADTASLALSLKAMVKMRFPEAVRDASAAFDAGMIKAGEATFIASMVLAGIDAAKESANPLMANRQVALIQ